MNFAALFERKHAGRFAGFMQVICILLALIMLTACVLAALGRIEVTMSTPARQYETLLIHSGQELKSRFLYTTFSQNPIYVRSGDGSVDAFVRIGMALMGIFKMLPMAAAFFLLARFFQNIADGAVFVRKNANYLLYGGLILSVAAVLTPLLCDLSIPAAVNALSRMEILLSTEFHLSNLIYGIIMLVAAYIMYYGISLQDEVDHTL